MENLTVKLLEQFQQSCQERIENIAEFLWKSKDSHYIDTKELQDICSSLHALKGEARMMSITEIADIVHLLEEKFQELQICPKENIPIHLFLKALGIVQDIVEAKVEQKSVASEIVQNIKKELHDNALETKENAANRYAKDTATANELVMEFCRVYPTSIARISNLLSSMKDSLIPDHKKLQSILVDLVALKKNAKVLGMMQVSEHFYSLAEKVQQIQRHKMWVLSVEDLIKRLISAESFLQSELKKQYSEKKKMDSIGLTKKHLKVEYQAPKEEKTGIQEASEHDITMVVGDIEEKNVLSASDSQTRAATLKAKGEIPLKKITEKKNSTKKKNPHLLDDTQKESDFESIQYTHQEDFSFPDIEWDAFAYQMERLSSLTCFLKKIFKNFSKTRNLTKEISCSLQNAKKMNPENFPDDLWQKALQLMKGQEEFHEQCSDLFYNLESSTESLLTQTFSSIFVAFSHLEEFLNRKVYEFSEKMGKEVKLSISGMKIELEKNTLRKIAEILIPILHNAVVHGIETPETRLSLGKPQCGNINITLTEKLQEVEIVITDDGKGLDLEKIAKNALESGSEKAIYFKNLSDKEKGEMIFLPQFSKNKASETISFQENSLPRIKRFLDSIQGKIRLSSEQNKGTTFTICVPNTIKKISLVLLKAGKTFVGIPMAFLETLLYLDPCEIKDIDDEKIISVHGRNLVLEPLDKKLGIAAQEEQSKSKIPAIIIKMGENSFYAYSVDQFLGEKEALIRPLNVYLKQCCFAYGILLDNGEIAYIPDIEKMVKCCPEEKNYPQNLSKKKILLVEDSQITREIQKAILHANGYEVIEAKNGRVALEILENYRPDLLITDIDMPEMNGLDLTKRIKENKKYKFPIIIVSASGSQKEILRGAEAGADAYILKGESNKENFIDTVKRWL
ncbi:MAG: response regulator [Candidatus Brocadiae bacterium]|nr:response regulator [Candidatus Brocadiia bacterium]